MKKETQKENKETTKAKPVEFSKHNVKISEWTNETKDGKEFKSYSLSKFYKDGEEWKTTSSFNYNDLQTLYLLLLDFLLNRYPSREKNSETNKENSEE